MHFYRKQLSNSHLCYALGNILFIHFLNFSQKHILIISFYECARPWTKRPKLIVYLFRQFIIFYKAFFFLDFRSARSLGVILSQILFGTSNQLVDSIVQSVAARSHHLFQEACRSILIIDRDFTLSQNRTMIHLFIQTENCNPSFSESICYSSLNRSCSTVFRQ